MERFMKRNHYTLRIRPRQLEILVSYMEEHPELAVGKFCEDIPRAKRKAMWKELVEKLNGVFGGPFKTFDQWKKTWKDQKGKAQIKANKIICNGENLAVKLTPIEDRILRLIGKKENPSSTSLHVPDGEIVFLPAVQQEVLPTTYENCLNVISSESREISSSAQSPVLPDTILQTPMQTDAVPEENITVTPDLNVASTSKCYIIIKPELYEVLEETSVSKSPLTITFSDMRASPFQKIKQKPIEEVSEETSASKSPLTITSSDIPASSLEKIKQEPVEEVFEETSVSKSPLIITSSDIPASPLQKKSFKRFRIRGKYRTAEKVAETFVSIAEKNYSVLERLAIALEEQAEESAKHTLLMQEMINAFKNR